MNLLSYFLQIIGVLWWFGSTSALKFLLYETGFGPSHIRFSNVLADAIVQNSEHIVDKILLPYLPVTRNSTVTKSIRHAYRVDVPDEVNPFAQKSHVSYPFEHAYINRATSPLSQLQYLFCEALLSNQELLRKLQNEKYDLLLTTTYDGCGYAIYHILQIPSMAAHLSTAGMDGLLEMNGIPQPPSFVTSVLRGSSDADRPRFFERLMRIVETIEDHTYFEPFAGAQKALDRYFPNIPSIREIAVNVTYLFVNTNEVLDLIKPISPKIKYIGGITLKTNPDAFRLGDEFERIIGRTGSKGTIVFSLGSSVRTSEIPAHIRRAFVEAFRQFPEYTVLWKDDEAPNGANVTPLDGSPNVFLHKWLPQTALLHDRRTVLFITHMGLNSYLELAHAGVPAVAIPLFVDQFYNSGCAMKHGLAVMLDKTKLSADSIASAIRRVLQDNSYTESARRVAKLLKQRPQPIGAAEFVRYLEYAAEFPTLGSDILQMASAKMTLYEYYSMDVILVLALIVTVLLVTVFLVLNCSLKFISRIKIKSE